MGPLLELESDVGAYVARGRDIPFFRIRTRATVLAPAETISRRVPQSVVVEALDAQRCVVHAGADTPQQLALHLLMLDADFTVEEPPELIPELDRLAGRLHRAVE